MPVMYNNVNTGAPQQFNIYYHMSTNNKSFLEMHQFLKDRGIQNNKFMLVLLNPELARIDPRDPNLPMPYRALVLRECLSNPWYFFREIIRVPQEGQAAGVPFQLNRGNLALLFCLMLNMNIYLELPRQTGKTIGAVCWYLYLYNFGTQNSQMSFLNKKLDDAKLNLQRLKNIRDLLPSYLKMDSAYSADGTKLKARSNVESMQHVLNNNNIKTMPSARSANAAASLLRGQTTPIIYMDEYAFMPYNNIVYSNMIPAFNTAAQNAKQNGSPYGLLLTSTPGFLTTDEGKAAFDLKNRATVFSENWYDLPVNAIMDIIHTNTNSNFVYIKYTYQQLGKSEEWFRDLCITLNKDWEAIRREILLEWALANTNSPFSPEDLDTIKSLLRQPINTVLINNKYELRIYEKIDLRYPPIMGVDVSGGYRRDSSAITIIDSYSTRVTAEMNNNFISTPELAMVIYKIVTEWIPNAVVNIERNGGFGASVIARLLQTSIRKNLFYTIKDKVVEERVLGSAIHKTTQKTKVYGSDSTKSERETLMEILRDRVEYHKDKIISPIIYEELSGLEVKKDGRIEHSSNTHDDQVFSWLWALYVYYYGGDLMRNWGITKHVLRTDADLEEAVTDIGEEQEDVVGNIDIVDNPDIQSQLETMEKSPGKKSYQEFSKEEEAKDNAYLAKILADKNIRNTLNSIFKVMASEYSENDGSSVTNIPTDVFMNFNKDDDEINQYSVLQGNLSNLFGGK